MSEGRREERDMGVVAVGHGGRDVGQLAGGLRGHHHVREHELDAMEVSDPLTELPAFPDVAERVIERALPHAATGGPQ